MNIEYSMITKTSNSILFIMKIAMNLGRTKG